MTAPNPDYPHPELESEELSAVKLVMKMANTQKTFTLTGSVCRTLEFLKENYSARIPELENWSLPQNASDVSYLLELLFKDVSIAKKGRILNRQNILYSPRVGTIENEKGEILS